VFSSRFKLIRNKHIFCEGQQIIFWTILYHVQPLLCNRRINNGVIEPVSRQRVGKHVSMATNTNTTVELPSETMFSTRSMPSGCKEDNWGDPVSYQ
jgi:hypothetical protein